MSAIDGNEVTQKIRAAIKTKLVELGAYVDDELPDYIMVMIANKKTKEQMTHDLSLFLGESTVSFTTWLQGVLDHLQAIAAEAKQRCREQQQQQQQLSMSSSSSSQGEAVVRPVLPPHMELQQQQLKRESPPPVVAVAPPPQEEPSLPEYSDEVLALKADPEPDDDLADDLRAIVEQAPPRQPAASSSSSISLVRPIPRVTPPEHPSSPPREQPQRPSQQQQQQPQQRSVVAAVVRRKPQFLSEGEEDEEEYDPSNPSVASSVVRVPERKSSVPESMQANKLLLLKAMKAAHQSVSRTTRRNPSARVEPYQPTPLRELGHQSASKRRRIQSPSRPSSARDDEGEDAIPPPTKRSSGLSIKHRLGLRPGERHCRRVCSARRAKTGTSVAEETLGTDSEQRVDVGGSQVMEQEEDSDLLELEVAREEVHSVVKEATPTSTPKHHGAVMDEGGAPSVMSRLGGGAGGDVPSPTAAAGGKQQWSPCFVVTLDGVDPLSFKGSSGGGGGGRQVLASGRDLEELPEDEEEEMEEAPPTARRPVKSRLITGPVTEVALMEGVVEEDEEAMAVEDGGVPRLLEKCRYWPACKNGDRCPFHHPSVPCKAFPKCKFGDRCLFIHPNCKYDAFCKRKDCPFTHASRRTFAPGPPPPPTALSSPPVQQCKFFPHCTNLKCPFFHPKPCKFGAKCQSATCPYTHPDTSVPPPNKLKWTAATVKKAPGAAVA
ncbi:nuclear polyadenosine RNA-binding 2 isoform X3 [Haemaphysalis longicornis]